MEFKKIQYKDLNGKEQERYNYQQVSAKFAEYGFWTILLDYDWKGSDFLAVHAKENITLRVQLKGRWGIWEKYRGKNIWICFPKRCKTLTTWHLYPHDNFLKWVQKNNPELLVNDSWTKEGCYHSTSKGKKWFDFFDKYTLS